MVIYAVNIHWELHLCLTPSKAPNCSPGNKTDACLPRVLGLVRKGGHTCICSIAAEHAGASKECRAGGDGENKIKAAETKKTLAFKPRNKNMF